MTDSEDARRIAALDDIELVRMLTIESTAHSPAELTIAEAEANRRGVPIDEGFIPREGDEALAEAESSDVGAFFVRERQVRCSHCGGERFRTRRILMNTRGLTYLKLDWLNRAATGLICAECGLVQFFADVSQDET